MTLHLSVTGVSSVHMVVALIIARLYGNVNKDVPHLRTRNEETVVREFVVLPLGI